MLIAYILLYAWFSVIPTASKNIGINFKCISNAENQNRKNVKYIFLANFIYHKENGFKKPLFFLPFLCQHERVLFFSSSKDCQGLQCNQDLPKEREKKNQKSKKTLRQFNDFSIPVF